MDNQVIHESSAGANWRYLAGLHSQQASTAQRSGVHHTWASWQQNPESRRVCATIAASPGMASSKWTPDETDRATTEGFRESTRDSPRLVTSLVTLSGS